MTTLAQQYDCLLLDLDGTVFRGKQPTDGSVDTLAAVAARTLYVTNNASRSPVDVAKNLAAMGFTAVPDDVVTSSQSAARLLEARLPAGAKVLIIGTEALAAEVGKVGLKPVRKFADAPAAVVQGHSVDTGWSDLAEAALAIRGGALWVAANVDRTLPSELGLLPGNGSMVAALRTATDSEPLVAGKPAPTLLLDALARGEFERPLVVGDRLDTDIAGANAAHLPSLLVLTGVATAEDVLRASADERPDFLGADLRSLLADPETVRIAAHPAWQVDIGPATATVRGTGQVADDALAVVRATASAVWGSDLDGVDFEIVADGDAAHGALERWALLGSPDRLA